MARGRALLLRVAHPLHQLLGYLLRAEPRSLGPHRSCVRWPVHGLGCRTGSLRFAAGGLGEVGTTSDVSGCGQYTLTGGRLCGNAPGGMRSPKAENQSTTVVGKTSTQGPRVTLGCWGLVGFDQNAETESEYLDGLSQQQWEQSQKNKWHQCSRGQSGIRRYRIRNIRWVDVMLVKVWDS